MKPAHDAGIPIHMHSGYDRTTLQRCENDAGIAESEPALFRMIRPEKLKQAARSLMLEEDVLYAPYLT